MASQSSHTELIYTVDDVPPVAKAIMLGFQHYLIMFGATVLIPLLLSEKLGITDPLEIGALIGTMFFVSGITTLLQTTLGNRLPIVQGGTFSLLVPALTICGMAELAEAGWQVRMQHVQGAIIAGAVFEFVLGATGLVGKLVRFISPVVIAPTIALIGLAVVDIGAPKAGKDWLIGGLTIVLIILFSQYMKSVHRAFQLFPIMLAILLAWAMAAVGTWAGVFQTGHAAHVSADAVAAAPWFRVPYPFQWGWPVFGVAAIVGMLAGYIASVVESIGDYYACARLSGAPVPDRTVISRGIAMEGLGCLVAGVFGTGNGTTSYSENIGAIGLTRVGSRRVIQVGAIAMIIFALFGKFGALFASIPEPIVGGVYCAMFGMIAAVGLSNLQFIDLNSARNLFIVGFSFFMGLSVPAYFKASPVSLEPDWLANIINTLGVTGMAVGAIIATLLDNTIPASADERGLTRWRDGH
ncbi:MAG: solute carrier family 23 protein [Proteobacteria bacterium]|nr:solute carrier family 23 protein [Pseudomonadota bacterium]